MALAMLAAGVRRPMCGRVCTNFWAQIPSGAKYTEICRDEIGTARTVTKLPELLRDLAR